MKTALAIMIVALTCTPGAGIAGGDPVQSPDITLVLACLEERGFPMEKEILHGGQVVNWVLPDRSNDCCRVKTSFRVFATRDDMTRTMRAISLASVQHEESNIAMFLPWITRQQDGCEPACSTDFTPDLLSAFANCGGRHRTTESPNLADTACNQLASAAREISGLTWTESMGTVHDGRTGSDHHGCRIHVEGDRANDPDDPWPHDILRVRMTSADWREDDARAADGAGSTSFAIRKGVAMCLFAAGWNAGDLLYRLDIGCYEIEEPNDMADDSHVHHGIDYIEFTVTDMAEAKRFYGAAFGWKFNDYGPDYAGIQKPAGGS